jgi:hypothetical protein
MKTKPPQKLSNTKAINVVFGILLLVLLATTLLNIFVLKSYGWEDALIAFSVLVCYLMALNDAYNRDKEAKEKSSDSSI